LEKVDQLDNRARDELRIHLTNNPNYNLGGKNLKSNIAGHGSRNSTKKKGVESTADSDEESSQQLSVNAPKITRSLRPVRI